MSRRFQVLVYGAGGFTGTLVLSALKTLGVSFAAAGRPSDALTRASAHAGCPRIEVSLDDSAKLIEHFASADVVLACAGPYASTGAALLDAALAARTHLLDLSGEPHHLQQTWQRREHVLAHDIAVVHSVGFDVIPSELLASLCQRPLGELFSLELATAHTSPIPSRGTLRSYLGMTHAHGLALIDGALTDEPLGKTRKVIGFDAPIGPRATASLASAEVVLLSRSLPTRNLSHLVATLAPALVQVADKALPTAAPDALKRALDHLDAHGERGPSEAARAQSQFSLWCEAIALDGAKRTMRMTGSDPYGLSATLAATCALHAAQPSFLARGILTPLQAFERMPLLATLANAGVRWAPVG